VKKIKTDIKSSRTIPNGQQKFSSPKSILRRDFLAQLGMVSVTLMLSKSQVFGMQNNSAFSLIEIKDSTVDEDIFEYIRRKTGGFDIKLYKQLVGAANEFKEGDQIAGIAAASENDRIAARLLISNTILSNVLNYPLFQDEQYNLIQKTTVFDKEVINMTFGQLKKFLLESDEDSIKRVMPSLSSDIIALVVKLMTNEELINVRSKVFNTLPNSKIGSKG